MLPHVGSAVFHADRRTRKHKAGGEVYFDDLAKLP